MKLLKEHGTGLAIFIVFLMGGLFIWCLATSEKPEDESIYVSILFIIPLIFQSVVLWRTEEKEQKGFYSIASFLSTCPYLVAWLLCRKGIFSTSTILSTGSIVFAFLLVAGVFSLTYHIIRSQYEPENGSSFMLDVANHMRRRSFLTICFFLSVFLCVTYLLSFAFAFHDRLVQSAQEGMPDEQNTVRRVALYAVKPAQYSDMGRKEGTYNQEETPPRAEAEESVGFTQGSAELIWYERNLDASKDEIRGALTRERNDEEYIEIAIKNNLALKEIRDTIYSIHDETNYQRIRVKLIGHCSREPLDDNSIAYRSNYELSQARISHTQLVIDKILTGNRQSCDQEGQNKNNLKWYNIEWLLAPLSSESHQLLLHQQPGTPDATHMQNDAEEWRRVDVSVAAMSEHVTQLHMAKLRAEPDRLKLLDYVYFTIYTITTTGYGDIIPVTEKAKFIASVANLFELFFIVVFFNVLVSSFAPQRDK